MNPVPRSVRRNFFSALVGNGVYAGTQFVMLVALAQLTSAEQLGSYALALALTAPVFFFLGLKLRQVQVTDAAGLNVPGDFYALRVLTVGLAFLVSLGIGGVVGLSGMAFWTLVWVAAHKTLESMIDILYGTLQRKEQLHLVARAQIARGIGGMCVFSGVLWWTRQVDEAAAGLAAFTVVALVGVAVLVRRGGTSLRLSRDPRVLRRLAILALPLGVSVSIGSVVANVPRYTLQSFEGTAAVGIFSALAYLLSAIGMVSNSLGEAVSPRMANQYVSGEVEEFRRTLKRSVLFGFSLGVAGVLFAVVFGATFLDLAYGAEYAEHARVLVVLMAAGAIQLAAVFVGTAVNALRMFLVQLPLTLITLATITAACLWLVPIWGLMGAAVAVAIADSVTGLCYLVLYRRRVSPRLGRLAAPVPG